MRKLKSAILCLAGAFLLAGCASEITQEEAEKTASGYSLENAKGAYTKGTVKGYSLTKETGKEDKKEEVNETIEIDSASDYFMTADSVKAFASADSAVKAIFGDNLKLTAKWYKDGNALSVKTELSGTVKTELNALGVTVKTDRTIEAKAEAKANEYGLITYEYSYSKTVDNSGDSPVTTITESKIEISWSK